MSVDQLDRPPMGNARQRYHVDRPMNAIHEAQRQQERRGGRPRRRRIADRRTAAARSAATRADTARAGADLRESGASVLDRRARPAGRRPAARVAAPRQFAGPAAGLSTGGRRLSSTPPRIGITSMTTVHPCGTHTSWPPIMMKMLMTASWPGSMTAWRRSRCVPLRIDVTSPPLKILSPLARLSLPRSANMLIVPSPLVEAGHGAGLTVNGRSQTMPLALRSRRLHDQARANQHDDHRPEQLPEPDAHDAQRVRETAARR